MPRPADVADVESNAFSYWTTRGFWAIADQALFAISNLIVNVLLARWLTPREYGAFVTAYVVLILVSVAHGGLLIEPMMFVGPSRYAKQFREYFSILIRFQWAFGAAAAATLLLVGLVAYAASAPLLGATFVGLACAAPFIFLSWLTRRACYAEGRPAIAALGSAVYLLIAGAGAALLYSLGLLTSMAGQLLMGAAGLAATAVIFKAMGYRWIPPRPDIDVRPIWREHWHFFRWAGSAGVLGFAQGLVFYLVLPFFGGLQASAALRATTNIVMPVLQSDSALIALIGPELARVRGNKDGVSRIVRWSTRLFALEGIACWLVAAVFRHDLVRLVYGDQYVAYADLLLILGALPLVSSRVNVLGAVLRARQRVRLVFWASALGAAASLVVGFSTMATLGALGAVIAMITADLVRIVAMTYFVNKPVTASEADGDVPVTHPPRSARIAEVRQ